MSKIVSITVQCDCGHQQTHVIDCSPQVKHFDMDYVHDTQSWYTTD